jgi:hypothetical protein
MLEWLYGVFLSVMTFILSFFGMTASDVEGLLKPISEYTNLKGEDNVESDLDTSADMTQAE